MHESDGRIVVVVRPPRSIRVPLPIVSASATSRRVHHRASAPKSTISQRCPMRSSPEKAIGEPFRHWKRSMSSVLGNPL
eukprot:gene8450-4899_t